MSSVRQSRLACLTLERQILAGCRGLRKEDSRTGLLLLLLLYSLSSLSCYVITNQLEVRVCVCVLELDKTSTHLRQRCSRPPPSQGSSRKKRNESSSRLADCDPASTLAASLLAGFPCPHPYLPSFHDVIAVLPEMTNPVARPTPTSTDSCDVQRYRPSITSNILIKVLRSSIL